MKKLETMLIIEDTVNEGHYRWDKDDPRRTTMKQDIQKYGLAYGIKVDIAETVAEALTVLQERDYDMHICDMGLPLGGDDQYLLDKRIEAERAARPLQDKIYGVAKSIKTKLKEEGKWPKLKEEDREGLISCGGSSEFIEFPYIDKETEDGFSEVETFCMDEAFYGMAPDTELKNAFDTADRYQGIIITRELEKSDKAFLVYTDTAHYRLGLKAALLGGIIDLEDYTEKIRFSKGSVIPYSEKLFIGDKTDYSAWTKIIDTAIEKYQQQ